jgi:hypothetical protein
VKVVPVDANKFAKLDLNVVRSCSNPAIHFHPETVFPYIIKSTTLIITQSTVWYDVFICLDYVRPIIHKITILNRLKADIITGQPSDTVM